MYNLWPVEFTLNLTLSSGNLYFSYVMKSDEQVGQPGDNRLYKCNVFNSHLDITTGGSYSSISVEDGKNPYVSYVKICPRTFSCHDLQGFLYFLDT